MGWREYATGEVRKYAGKIYDDDAGGKQTSKIVWEWDIYEEEEVSKWISHLN